MEKRVLEEIKEQLEEESQVIIEGFTIFELPESIGKFL